MKNLARIITHLFLIAAMMLLTAGCAASNTHGTNSNASPNASQEVTVPVTVETLPNVQTEQPTDGANATPTEETYSLPEKEKDHTSETKATEQTKPKDNGETHSNIIIQDSSLYYNGKVYVYSCPEAVNDAENWNEIGTLVYTAGTLNADLSTNCKDLNGCAATHLSGGLTNDAMLVRTAGSSSSLFVPENAQYPNTYEYSDNGDGTVTITKYRGSEENVEIPTELDGKTVTAIGNLFYGEGAFSNCPNVRSVTVPEGVTILQDNAFYGCFKLETVYLPASLVRIENCAFNGCPALANLFFKGDAPSMGNYVFDSPLGQINLHYSGERSGWDAECWNGFRKNMT